MKLFHVTASASGFAVANQLRAEIVMDGFGSNSSLANQVTELLNACVEDTTHIWQHVLEAVLEPLVENWETHVGPKDAAARGVQTTQEVFSHLVQQTVWLRQWLGNAESVVNDPANQLQPDSAAYVTDEHGQTTITYGDIRAQLQLLNELDYDERDVQMIVGATYRHADGDLYLLVAIDVDHKGEDGEWRPGVLYRPAMNGVSGDRRLKTTTVERWRDRFVFAG